TLKHPFCTQKIKNQFFLIIYLTFFNFYLLLT
ncbi:MAG: hypothetical protein ACI9LN_004881, partial [Saprospiraceae bacterium]